MSNEAKKRKWYDRLPDPVVMLFGMTLLAAAFSYIIPAGLFEMEEVNGMMRVVPNSYAETTPSPLGIMDYLTAFPDGFKVASDIIFVVLISGVMFGILNASGMVENVIGTLVRRLGRDRQQLVIIVMTYVFGLLGVSVGYENNIAMIPIAAVLSIALGGDLILAAGMSVGAITIGFGLSPINAYTVGTGHQIADLPLFSGFGLRGLLCFLGLSVLAWFNLRYYRRISGDLSSGLGADLDQDGLALSKPLEEYGVSPNNWMVLGVFVGGLGVMLYGVFLHHWYLREIGGVFLMISLCTGLVARMNPTLLSRTLLDSVAIAAPGAFMVGYATVIKVLLERGQVSDTIAYYMSENLVLFSRYGAAVLMSLGQCVMNFMIPSGSGQALATLPILLPVGELVGITRQSTILAFQIGDGVTNLFNPTLGGLIAMLSLCRVPFDRWLQFIMPIVGWILMLAWMFLLFSVAINWGPA